jgi:hypothetical protein
MQKEAQKRSLINKLREKVNFGGEALEQLFSPDSQFLKIMNDLRQKDDLIRAIVMAKDVEDISPPSNVDKSMKDLLKSAKDFLNRREYVRSIVELSKFHDNMKLINDEIKSFGQNVNLVHEQFLFEGLDPEDYERLKGVKEKFNKKKASCNNKIIKEAGIMDFIRSIGNDRLKALIAWEKRYPAKVRLLKRETAKLLSRSEALLDILVSTLKQMATFRATRRVDDYIKASQKIINNYNNYDTQFKEYYQSQVKDFIENSKYLPFNKPEKVNTNTEVKPESETTTIKEPIFQVPKAEQKEMATQEIKPPSLPVVPKPAIPDKIKLPSFPFPLEKTEPPKVSGGGGAPTIKDEEAPPTEVTGPPQFEEDNKYNKPPYTPSIKGAHSTFFNSLKKMAGEDPIILASYINKYSKMIEKTDKITSDKLKSIVRNIGR